MAPDFAPSMNLQMRQSMQMVMTPQMIQSMEMLQLPLLALEQKIQQEILENPALEILELNEDGAAATDDEDTDPGSDETLSELDAANEDLRKVDEIDYDWDSNYDELAPRRGSADDDEFDLIANTAGPGETFYEYLENQLGDLMLADRQRRLVSRLIYCLEPSGYLTMPLLETVDPEEEPPPSEEELEEALIQLQRLDPPGIGARDARECLLLQIDRTRENHDFARNLVLNHLEDIAANRLPQIARTTHHSIDEVKDAIAYIRTLNPHPGLDHSRESDERVVPDVICEVDDDGEWTIRLVNGSVPEISDMFMALFDKTKHGKKLRDEILADPERAPQFHQMKEMLKQQEQGKMLREKYQSARWLMTAIAQRERTLMRVAQEIVDAQKPFLAGQSDAPAPLLMKDVAERLNIDIGTVCRAVQDKYMVTPLGMKPMRMFFTHAVGGDGNGGGQAFSNQHIMNRIREIIDAEDKTSPLKDDQIQEMLTKHDIDIKRRTVAKYRKNLGYPNHSQRREY